MVVMHWVGLMLRSVWFAHKEKAGSGWRRVERYLGGPQGAFVGDHVLVSV